jgi:pimeloyl-ACP methyl ester carboxylesterase
MTSIRIEERLVFFPCEGLSLAGILTVPADPNGFAVLIPWGGGAYPSSGRNRLRARLAKTVAERGFHAFRFDYRGVGESDGEYRLPDLGSPYVEEIVAASEWLNSQGLTRLVIVANCFGGWSSLVAAPLIPNLEGIAVVNSPVRRDHQQAVAVQHSWQWWFTQIGRLSFKKLRSPQRRARYRKMVAAKAAAIVGTPRSDSRFVQAIRNLLSRNVPILLIYGNDDFRADLESELNLGLRPAIDEAGPITRLTLVDERLEGCASLEAQQVLLNEVVPWLDDVLRSKG